MRGLLHDSQRGAQLFMLGGKRGDRRIVAPLAREQRLEVPLDFILRTRAAIGHRLDPLDRVDARVMRLVAENDIPVDVIDERRVELLLAREDAREQPARARREARLQPAAGRRAVDDLVKAVETLELMAIRRGDRGRLRLGHPLSVRRGLRPGCSRWRTSSSGCAPRDRQAVPR